MYKPCTADLLSSGLVFFSTMGLRSVRTESSVLGLPFDTAGRGGKQGLNLSLPLRFGVWSQCPATFPHAECEQGKASLVSRGFADSVVFLWSAPLCPCPPPAARDFSLSFQEALSLAFSSVSNGGCHLPDLILGSRLESVTVAQQLSGGSCLGMQLLVLLFTAACSGQVGS